MQVKLTRLIVIVGLFLLVFGLSSTGKVAWAADPAITTPIPGSALSSSTVTFQWSAGDIGADRYYLGVGTSQASVSNSPWGDIFAGPTGLNTSQEVTGIPINGNTVYVILWWRIGTTWFFTDYTYQTTSNMQPFLGINFIIALQGSFPSVNTTSSLSDPSLGEIRMFAGNFAPRGWALCDGQLLPIDQNQALFSILGTIYGGDGRTTFALPDLRGRVPLHSGTGPGLTPRTIGQKGGAE